MQHSTYLKTGTAGGLITILFANVNAADLVKTTVLAAVGATVSLAVSYALKKLFEKKK